MNTESEENDLIASKEAEYSEIPGMVLGLDGWILKSIQKEQREQFLNGYLKLLRVTFHPDRYSNESQKLSRQNFLQAADEAVSFMLRDEYSFEITSENVPTRKNPLVSLRQSVDSLQAIVESSSARENDLSSKISSLIQKVADGRSKLDSAGERIEALQSHALTMRSHLKKRTSESPVPIRLSRYEINGNWIDFKDFPLAVEAVARWASKNKMPEDILERWEGLLKSNSSKETIHCKLGRSGAYGAATLAFTPADMVQFVRAKSFPKKPGLVETRLAISQIGTSGFNECEAMFTLPFFYPGMLLFFEGTPESNHGKRGFFMVDSCDSTSGQYAAAFTKLKEFKAIIRRDSEIKRECKSELKALKIKLKALEKK